LQSQHSRKQRKWWKVSRLRFCKIIRLKYCFTYFCLLCLFSSLLGFVNSNDYSLFNLFYSAILILFWWDSWTFLSYSFCENNRLISLSIGIYWLKLVTSIEDKAAVCCLLTLRQSFDWFWIGWSYILRLSSNSRLIYSSSWILFTSSCLYSLASTFLVMFLVELSYIIPLD
jgi:hypothetical protein